MLLIRGSSGVAIALVTALALVGCGDSSSTSGRTTNRSALDGRTFLSQSVTEDGAPRPLAGPEPITLTFDGDRLGAQPGCNSLGGTYTLDVDRLEVADLAMTEMACMDTALMDQDQWFAEILLAEPTLALAGDTLTMTSGSTILVFVDRETADPARPLEGTAWVLDTIVEGETASSVPAGVTADLTIAEGRLAAALGCNRGTAPVEVGDTTLEIGPMAATFMACPDAETSVETAMLATLEGQVDFEIDGPVLRIRNGDRGLDFRAA
jgi:heat shock protein HslJ